MVQLSNQSPLTDTLGRIHTSLRISVTDRCNIRCFYCMPNENVRFRPRNEILSFQKISRREGLDRVLAGIAAAQKVGFKSIRLNAIAIRGLTENEIIPLAAFA